MMKGAKEELEQIGLILITVLLSFAFLLVVNSDEAYADTERSGEKELEDGTEGAYTTYEEMLSHLEYLNATYPDIVGLYNLSELYNVPLTHENRTLWAVKLSDNPHKEEKNETDVLICGLHHAREWATVEVVLNFLDYMVENYESDVRVRMLVDEREMWLVPIVNPDGHAYSQARQDNVYNASNNDGWRKNMRDNDGDGEHDDTGENGGGDGVDLNRNYQYLWFDRRSCSLDPDSLIYRGPYDTVDDDGDWQGWDGENWNDDLNMNGVPDIDWDGPGADANGDDELFYDPEPHVNEDPVDAIDNDEDGFLDEDPAGGLTEPETMAIAALALDPEHDFRAMFTYHAYGEYYLMNRGVEEYGRPPEWDQMRELGLSFTDINGYDLYDNSGYGTTGMTEDWFYYRFGTVGYTIELGEQFIPAEDRIEEIEAENLEQNLILSEYSSVVGSLLMLDGFEDGGNRNRWETGGSNASWDHRFDPTPGQGGTNGISGDHYLSTNGYNSNSSSWFSSRDPIDLTGLADPKLSFWHRYDFDTEDGGFVEIRRSGSSSGSSWMPIHPVGLYPATFGDLSGHSDKLSCYSGYPSFSGTSNTWEKISFDMSDYRNETIDLRFHMISDSKGEREGWCIDNVAVHDGPALPYDISIEPNIALEGQTVNFTLLQTGATALRSSLDGEFFNGTNGSIELDDLSVGYHTIYICREDASGNWTCVAARSLLIHKRPLAFIDSLSPKHAGDSETVSFRGHGTDDGTITRYAWRSSLDGEIRSSTSPNFGTDRLSVGEHTIYFRVRDDNGVWSFEVSETLIVTQEPEAHVDLVSPNPALDTETVSFKGHGTDDGSVERYVWRSSLDGELHNDTFSTFSSGELTPGEHTVYFRVRDDHGVWSHEVSTLLLVHTKPVAYIDTISPSPALTTDSVTLSGHGIDDGSVTRYAWYSSLDSELYNDTSDSFSLSNFSVGIHTLYFRVQDEHGVWSDNVSTPLLIHTKPVAHIDSISPSAALDTETVVFSGHGTDDGNVTRYIWRSSIDGKLYSGTSGSFSSGSLSNGTHIIYLRVQDDLGVWGSEISSDLTINGEPQAIINTISPSSALSPDPVIFFGHGIDDGNIIRYVWSSSLDGELYNGTESLFKANDLSTGKHTINFRVLDDSLVWSDEVSGTVLVTDRPAAHIASSFPVPLLNTEMVSFEGYGTDDGTIIRYVWASNIDGEFYNDTEGSCSFSGLSSGTHMISFKVQDNHAFWSEEDSFELVIHTKPRAEIVSITPEIVVEGKSITFAGKGTDDGSLSRYVWTSALDSELYNGSDATFIFSNLSVGEHEIFLKVQDNNGVWSEEASGVLVVREKEENDKDKDKGLGVIVVLVALTVLLSAVVYVLLPGMTEKLKSRQEQQIFGKEEKNEEKGQK